METLLTFVIAAMVTLFFVRGYLRKLTTAKQARSTGTTAAVAVVMQPCPRCTKAIPKGSAFCSHCGAALAMWSIHSAEVKSGNAPAGQGKPKPVINASLCVGCGTCVEVCPETGTLELVNGKAILAHAERCTSHAKCAEVCPTQAIAMAAGGVLQTVKVPWVKADFETNVPGIFIVGELGGMGLIKTAINEGKLVIDHVRRRIQEQQHGEFPSDAFDVAIIGAGPAGLSASLSAEQHELRYLTVEQGEIASTIRQYPRQKFLMAEPIDIPLYGSLYVADGTKEALLSVWETILKNTGVRVQTNERLERVERNNAGFHIDTGRGSYYARYVVLAMGRRGSPRRLEVPGEEMAKVAYRLIEADTYENENILVVGGGDSALEAALALSKSGKNSVTLCHRGEGFNRARDRNRERILEAASSGRVHALLNSRVREIRADSVLVDNGGAAQELPNSYVFALLGGRVARELSAPHRN
jgi:thioredoxin reductase (NADPH)